MAEEHDHIWRSLAAKAQSGDAAAYRELLTGLVPVIRRAVVRTLPAPEMADDVVQEVLISVHKALSTYNPERPFLPWLMAIVSFRRTDYLRTHYSGRYNAQVPLEDLDSENYLTSEGAGASYNGPEYKDIQEALNSLPKGQQKVIELMKIKGLTAKEVSDETGMSVSAVKVSVHRALQKLREKLG